MLALFQASFHIIGENIGRIVKLLNCRRNTGNMGHREIGLRN